MAIFTVFLKSCDMMKVLIYLSGKRICRGGVDQFGFERAAGAPCRRNHFVRSY
jgi:hypothetical protein